MTGWEARYEGVYPRRRQQERVDPAEAALIARLEAAGWTVVDRRAGEDVAVRIAGLLDGDGLHFQGRTFAGPTAVWALREACEAVGA